MSVRSLGEMMSAAIEMEGLCVSRPEEFAGLCVKYIRRLNACPIFDGVGFSGVDLRPVYLGRWKCAVEGRKFEIPPVTMLEEPAPHKILKMDSWEDSVITDILLENAMIRFKAHKPEAPFQMMVHTTGGCPNGLRFANGEYVGTGLSLIVDKKNEDCPYLRLEQIFRDVIKETKNGWRVATDEERERATYYPMDRRTFQSKKDDYLMYVKKSRLHREDDLIRNIFVRLGDPFICRASWRGKKLPVTTNKIYAWIKKPC